MYVCLCIGKYTDIKKKQQEKEKEAENEDMGMNCFRKYPMFIRLSLEVEKNGDEGMEELEAEERKEGGKEGENDEAEKRAQIQDKGGKGSG